MSGCHIQLFHKYFVLKLHYKTLSAGHGIFPLFLKSLLSTSVAMFFSSFGYVYFTIFNSLVYCLSANTKLFHFTSRMLILDGL